ncbi:MAG: UvrD/REP helicase [Candidatus Curtissbacteria bacterium GW2011_GWA1_40_47]|uniref:DNA helicase UvrD n=1 Tax=Candidatus Curtissbacteria bacterium RIFOXYA1_FULL_41_14 TaxID=1797737 RepID=A0A1F5HGI6_9BACT|nr:MAG: UvrD/REP helicase [Candidatus Curtissbacteria bacterium GW2011_GWB1_40_28]KKR60070.1 MAG: UvrD/REP helicase [Candidatus Curtissbacteria bacterium GW2011_GWA2_40_31]KKR60938.1 MAG: UvrD/REP helicase [Microgenomates group bacterium GW2011_GWC1_40_35]KKR65761.1 MAG: UvrD/REP helicase [Candidatus Curtissbacteria bacterium GW2011_GWA1_40_47]KKR76314.1 MAG: UvrD/REP helicase [Candidatus Curtissbacteria bacterium GW2011_GWD1_40_8]KKS01384.1 MAG: UvrD/REP helicase [Candidatus Curtissbacteria b
MKFITDLHLHSKYSRAVSQEMGLSQMAEWAKFKGISVLATGDFTHPFWFDQIKNELVEAGNGLCRLKSASDKSQVISDKLNNSQEVFFLLSCEISSIYSQGGKTRRIHNLFFFPSIQSVEKFNGQLLKRGANLRSDGRPIVGLTSRDLSQIALECDQKTLIIPAHIWTPWFSVFGSFSGFDSLEECFGDMTDYIYAVETGLSSDPAMNWRIADLDRRAILSFSDAHSLEKMGREATVFEGEEISYNAIYDAIVKGPKVTNVSNVSKGNKSSETSETFAPSKIAFTIEFYPEEGKYHYTGHRDCNYSQNPEEGEKKGNKCPVCGRSLTIGVMDRVEELASRNSKMEIRASRGVKQVYSEDSSRPPYISLVPLSEILAEALGVGVGTKTVMDAYLILVNQLDSEFNVLLKADLRDIARLVSPNVVEGINKIRNRDIVVEPGYDGKFGIVKIWPNTENVGKMQVEEEKQKDSQLNLFA